MNNKLSHVNEDGNASMVDVSEKQLTSRIAVASGRVLFPSKVFRVLSNQDFLGKKGGIVQTAVIAGIQGVKKTSELIPLCHQINLTKIDVDIVPGENEFHITCTVKCNGKTGVEMEALTGVSTAALTIYDMCKALSQDIVISTIQLESKSGGKNDFKR
ncbi:cyclic pyranopterin monophosphate synthase MoaC [Maribacter cobaltidurans]|uniref:cyclic pyranopterin monophosphate synthase n=1 Tax=Maribacter cobaltidurans TaxID=1178778 RepID=A0A223V193_9FLAO|nr:cyclic pyranopterin monophosphate synthase MoaC [Maribacter cobaltidurans]ASV28920.1 cyclic pyranopterin monophosphate synthase MoaC [Maribacter cobaltidurans]GGD73675.1 cyclic pyranopterin monophosphate synthase accessory protein [Maribacter cobaltidurans]